MEAVCYLRHGGPNGRWPVSRPAERGDVPCRGV